MYRTMFGPENSVFVPFVLLSLSCCAICADLSDLLPTYNQGVNNYNSILKSLVSLNTSADTTSDAVFFQEILQYANNSLNGFSQCAALATTKGDAFAEEELRLNPQLDHKKGSLQAKEKERGEQQQKLNRARNQLSTQTKRLQSAINTLYGTKLALRVAEKKVDDAKKCFVRRKRDFFGSLTKEDVKDVSKNFESPIDHIIRICALALNELTGDLNRARQERIQARATVANQQDWVDTVKQQLAFVQNNLNQLIQTEADLQEEIEETIQEITEFNAQLNKVMDLKNKLRQVSAHLAAVIRPYGPSISAIQLAQERSVLNKVAGLFSLESLIGQLHDVARALSGSAESVPRFMQITNEEKERLHSQIEAFKEKLRQLEDKQNKLDNGQLSDKESDVAEDFD